MFFSIWNAFQLGKYRITKIKWSLSYNRLNYTWPLSVSQEHFQHAKVHTARVKEGRKAHTLAQVTGAYFTNVIFSGIISFRLNRFIFSCCIKSSWYKLINCLIVYDPLILVVLFICKHKINYTFLRIMFMVLSDFMFVCILFANYLHTWNYRQVHTRLALIPYARAFFQDTLYLYFFEMLAKSWHGNMHHTF